MTKYAKGANFERSVRRFLEEKGWHVIRSAGSHGLADLIAIQPFLARVILMTGVGMTDADLLKLIHKQPDRNWPRVLLVQCKYKMPEKREALERMEAKKQQPLIELTQRLGCEAVWATNTPGSLIPNLQWLYPKP